MKRSHKQAKNGHCNAATTRGQSYIGGKNSCETDSNYSTLFQMALIAMKLREALALADVTNRLNGYRSLVDLIQATAIRLNERN